MSLNRIASRHYAEMDRPVLTIETGRFDYTEAQPETPEPHEMSKAQDIVIHHIEEGHYRADESGGFVNLDVIHALITVDLGVALNPVDLNLLIATWPDAGIFDDEDSREAYEAEVRGLLRAQGWASR